MVGLGWGVGHRWQLPWVLRKGGTGSCLPKKATLGGMGGEDHTLHTHLGMLGISIPLSPCVGLWAPGSWFRHSFLSRVVSSIAS